MIDAALLHTLEIKINQVSKQGHGEVVLKIKNGYVYRIVTTEDDLLPEKLDKHD